MPLEETLGALAALREEGLIRELGVSNFPSALLREAAALAPCLRMARRPCAATLSVPNHHEETNANDAGDLRRIG